MDIVGRAAASSAPRRPVPQIIPAGPAHASAEDGVTALYHAHALGLIRLAHIMLGDRTAAEDVVQDSFCGLYRNWSRLADQAKALPYVRSSVLNGCRSSLRRRRPVALLTGGPGDGGAEPAALITAAVASAEAAVLSVERRREVMTALRALPDRQREVLVLRFYLDLPDTDIARDMGISQSTVRSTAYRALAALGRSLGDSK
jgi:RNA polymerase sigma-70 factor (sigma-E family)